MILYIQTPSIPRSKIHNNTIKGMIEYLDSLDQFSEIRWFINIDAIQTNNITSYEWEDVNITKLNFENISKSLTKTKTSIQISYQPCFYLAFRSLTLSVLNDISSNNIKDSDFCVLWLEDDWIFTDTSKFKIELNIFLNSNEYLIYVLHKNKINMGGNPDIIKGTVFNLFRNINLDIDNKRDPENIRKYDVWYPNIFIDVDDHSLDTTPYYSKWSQKLVEINNNHAHHMRQYQTKILSSNVVNGDIGDNWRSELRIDKNWSTKDKYGILSNKSYTYK